ncbi:MAG: Trk system potassium transporter TrkA [Bauldia sp.]|jgi:trk system potassium uptake protein TrkA|nr:Trk system potassium transporter TrkA [Bauldia sp.]
MRVVICGAGQVGYGIAERLAAEQHDVSVIDTQVQLVHAVRDTLDVRAIVGNGAHPDVLAEAGAEGADMIVAVTLNDEVNMIACQVAHSLFSVPTKIARIRSPAYREAHWSDLFSNENLPIDVIISPEVEVGEMVVRRLGLPGADDIVRFADDKVAVIGVECRQDCPVVDTPLDQLSELFPDLEAVVVGIFRNGVLRVPHSEDFMLAGDLVYVVANAEHVRRTLSVFGHEEQEAKRVVIAGGGNIGFYVASALEKRGARTRVKVIEPVRERAIAIAEDLRSTIVLNGSALNREILREADIEETDTLVAVTNDDKINLLACVMAKRLGAKRTMTLVNDPSFGGLTPRLDIDAVVNPRAVTVSRVLQHVRRGRIRAVYSIGNGEAEVLEAEALETSPLVGRPLRDLDLPEGIRIGAIYRGGKVLMPKGGLMVQAKDRVILYAAAERVRAVEQMFRVSLEFF